MSGATTGSDVKRVLVIYTGGTIGMMEGPRGYVPAAGYLRRRLMSLPQFHDPALPELTTPPSRFGRRVRYEVLEHEPLLDSANMGREHWVRIAGDVEQHYVDYDGFVVLHGTDTMSYTASALSFMLEHLSKTVIVTGSQIPISQLRNDAADNLLHALMLAGLYEIPEVCLYFRGKLFRGNRTQKVDAAGLDAFASGNYPPLAQVGVNVEVDWSLVRSRPGRPLAVAPITNSNVAALRVFPGIQARILAQILRPPLEGVVLETYGTGNAPSNREDFTRAIRDAVAAGLVIVNVTQCHKGSVSTDYATGAALAEAGVVSGADMTPEAALTKLSYLLSLGLAREEVERRIQRDLRGELTEPTRERYSIRERDFVRIVARALGRLDGGGEAVQGALYPVLMCSAAALGDREALDRMLQAGADPNAPDYDGRTPLHLAAAEGREAVVEALLAAGARPNAADRWGHTPLVGALKNDRQAVVRLLEARGALRRPEDVTSAISTASGAGDLEGVRRLVENGGDPRGRDDELRTPLHFAARAGRTECASYLLSCGADPTARDRFGQTPVHEAERAGHTELAALLRRAAPDVAS